MDSQTFVFQLNATRALNLTRVSIIVEMQMNVKRQNLEGPSPFDKFPCTLPEHKGKDHCKKKRWREDKERLQNESKSAKSLSATGLKRPNTKGQARNTLEKKSKSKHVTPILSANSRAPQGSVQFGKEKETKPLQMKVESKDEAVSPVWQTKSNRTNIALFC